MPRSNAQNRVYWCLIRTLGIDEDTRRAMLLDRYRALSSRGLSTAQMADQINWLRYLAGEAPRYEPAVVAGGASVNQVRFIEGLERDLGWDDNPDRLAGFLRKVVGVETASGLTSRQAARVIETLKAMHKRQAPETAETKGIGCRS